MMFEALKALAVVFTMGLGAFINARMAFSDVAGGAAIDRYRNVFLAVSIAAFMIPNFWVMLFVMSAIAVVMGAAEKFKPAIFLLLLFARGMDILSTWIATPNLVLEGNPLARKLGWRWGIPVKVAAVFGLAAVADLGHRRQHHEPAGRRAQFPVRLADALAGRGGLPRLAPKRERVKEQLVEIDMRTGLPAKGSKPVTTGMYNVDSGSCYRIELANTSTKAYPNLKVVWTLHYTQPAKKPDWNNHMRDTKPKDVTRTGSQAVSLNLGSKSLVTTEVVAGEIKGYKIELYDGQNLLAVETKGMPGK